MVIKTIQVAPAPWTPSPSTKTKDLFTIVHLKSSPTSAEIWWLATETHTVADPTRMFSVVYDE